MKLRGKILRDPGTAPGGPPGLLIVGERQYAFALEGVWRSESPPAPGLAVYVELLDDGRVGAITAVPESQLAREQAEQALALARAKGARCCRPWSRNSGRRRRPRPAC